MRYILPVFVTLSLVVLCGLLSHYVGFGAGLVLAAILTWPNAMFFYWWVDR